MGRLGTCQLRVALLVLVFLPLMPLFACSSPSPASDVTGPSQAITREQAVGLARQHISFEPTSIAAETDSRQGRPVWVVTFRRADGSHGGLGQFVMVILDSTTGELIALATS